MQAETLHQDERYRITLFRSAGGGQTLSVSFEHGRDAPADGFEPATCPRYAARLGIDALMVQTARRDWFISPQSDALSDALRRITAGWPEVVTTGFSMGGYAALLYSADCHARRVMAVSPQYCIDPAIAPYDPARRRKFIAIGQPMPCPETRGDRAISGVLLYDPSIRPDRIHAARITLAFPNLTPLALPYGGHPATSVIGAAGGIGQIAEMIAKDRLDISHIRALHRRNRRQADSYRLNMARAALARHPDRACAELYRLAQDALPQFRFEAGLLLLRNDHVDASDLLLALLEDMPGEPPPAWLRRLDQALGRLEARGPTLAPSRRDKNKGKDRG